MSVRIKIGAGRPAALRIGDFGQPSNPWVSEFNFEKNSGEKDFVLGGADELFDDFGLGSGYLVAAQLAEHEESEVLGDGRILGTLPVVDEGLPRSFL